MFIKDLGEYWLLSTCVYPFIYYSYYYTCLRVINSFVNRSINNSFILFETCILSIIHSILLKNYNFILIYLMITTILNVQSDSTSSEESLPGCLILF